MSKAKCAPLLPGTVIGKHRVETLIAQGGSSFVYRASGPCGPVAIKEHLPHALVSRRAGELQCAIEAAHQLAYSRSLKRFLNEARIISSLRLSGVVHGNECVPAQGNACIVMEWLQGRSLHALMAGEGLSAAVLHRLALDLLGTLHEVHQQGLLHLDIKPGNVMLCDDGRAVLLDFGAALTMPVGQPTLDADVPWSPGFSPPELLCGRKGFQSSAMSACGVGPWSDLHALAATLLAAFSALEAAGLQEATHNPLPARWAEVLEPCLHADGRLRPHSAHELRLQLQETCTP